MKSRSPLLLLISFIFLFFLNVAHADKIRPSTVLYKLNSDVTASELKSLNGLLHSNGLLDDKVIDNLGLHIAKFDTTGRELAISKILQASGAVQFAEPDYEVSPTLTLTPNDPLYGEQWHHNAIRTPEAWGLTTGSASVLVAVCDTGVDSDHPDLVNNLVLPGYNATDGSTYVEDVHGHGTGTIGSVGAVGNNGIGLSGVNWGVSIIPVKINISDHNSSAYISTMANCIGWSADQGAKVVNLSYGGIESAAIDDAATYLRDRGGLLFMSAGNDGVEQVSFPDYSSFVAVGATDQANAKASFSSWGTYVDLVAPGVKIKTTYKDAGYHDYSGTSFSSPIVAGVAALLYAVNPEITPLEVENALFDSAVSLGDEQLFGHGLVNAFEAVNIVSNLQTNIAPSAEFIASSVTGAVPLDVYFDASASSDSDGVIVSYEWDFGDGATAEGVMVNHTYTSGGVFNVGLTVTDDLGKSAIASTDITVTNELPVVTLTATPMSGDIPLNVDFDASASYDPDGEIVSYAWSFGDGSNATGPLVQHTYTSGGNFTATLVVTDNGGAVAESNVVIQVSDPSVVNAPTDLAAAVNGDDVQLTWLDQSNNETLFLIERAKKVRGKYKFSQIASVTENVQSFMDTNLEVGNYKYRVYAVNSNGPNGDITSDYSLEVAVKVETSVTEPPPPGQLPAPSNLNASLSGATVSLNWQNNATDADGVYIERGLKTKGNISFERIGTIYYMYLDPSPTASYTDTLISKGIYLYRVQAFRQSELSEYSNSDSVRIR